MPRKKRDREKVKSEYFHSDIAEVKRFMQDTYKMYNGEIAKRTTGWAKEKEIFRKKMLDQSIENSIQKGAKDLEIPVETLKKAKNAAVVRVINMLAKSQDDKDDNGKDGKKKKKDKPDLTIADIERILRILKTELGEPITINKNDNVNTEKLEAIHVVMSQKSIDEYKNDMWDVLELWSREI